MRVLLIATNRHDKLQSRLNAQPMPIGLAYIAGHLDHERHEVKVLDLMFSNDHLADLEATVKPDKVVVPRDYPQLIKLVPMDRVFFPDPPVITIRILNHIRCEHIIVDSRYHITTD